MGGKNKKRNRRRHRNKHQPLPPQSPHAHAQSAARRFAEYSHTSHLQHILQYEEYKQSQKQFLQEVADLQNDRMERTVFVTNVKDVAQANHLQLLKAFLERTYGPVEDCRISSYSSKKKKQQRRGSHNFSPALVRFVRKGDAQKLFGGRDLLSTTSSNTTRSVDLDCPTVGVSPRNSGRAPFVRVQAAHRDKILEDLQSNSIQFSSDHMAIGHWILAEDDAYLNSLQDEEGVAGTGVGGDEEFVQEALLLGDSISIEIDLASRTMTLRRSHSMPFTGSNESSFENLFAFLDMNLSSTKTDVLTFRFKDIKGCIDLCCDQSNEVHFVFSLRLPPKLYLETSSEDYNFSYTSRTHRQAEFAGLDAEVFGRCLGFKIRASQTALTTLKMHNRTVNLKKFGLFREHLEVDGDTSQICVTNISDSLTRIDGLIHTSLRKLHKKSAQLGKYLVVHVCMYVFVAARCLTV